MAMSVAETATAGGGAEVAGLAAFFFCTPPLALAAVLRLGAMASGCGVSLEAQTRRSGSS